MRRPTFQLLTTTFTLAVAACKKEPLPEPPPVPDASATTATITRPMPPMRPGQLCPGTIVDNLHPAKAVDYLELRLARETAPEGTRGEACKGAKDVSACRTALVQPSSDTGHECLVYTRGEEIKAVSGRATAAFLAPIDNADEAAIAVVFALAEERPATRAIPPCVGAAFKATNDGWETTYVTGSDCDGKNSATYAVSKSGVVTTVKTEQTPPKPETCRRPVPGRRPEGLLLEARGDIATIGGHLAEAAEMEAASVPAFERLEAELRALRAPTSLVRRAKRAAADEVRHADTMTNLAARFGGAPRALEIEPHASRALVDMAIENAIEGCVFETWAALLAHWQADHANDVAIRSAMKTIARDETRHAALAWDVATFLDARLSKDERARVATARADAFARLAESVSDEIDDDLRATVGLPSTAQTRALLVHLIEVAA